MKLFVGFETGDHTVDFVCDGIKIHDDYIEFIDKHCSLTYDLDVITELKVRIKE